MKQLPVTQDSPQPWNMCNLTKQAINLDEFSHLINPLGTVRQAIEMVSKSGDVCQKGTWVVFVKNEVRID